MGSSAVARWPSAAFPGWSLVQVSDLLGSYRECWQSSFARLDDLLAQEDA